MQLILFALILLCLSSQCLPFDFSSPFRKERRAGPLGGLLDTPPARSSVTRISLDKLKSQTKARSLNNSTRLSVERAFDSLLDVCTSDAVASESLHQAFETLNVMRSCGVKLSKSAYLTVISACIDSITGSSKHQEADDSLIISRKKSPQHLSSFIASCSINSVRCEALDVALETISAMHNHSVPLDHRDFSALFKAIETFSGRAGPLQRGIRAMRAMLDSGFSPDAVVCNALLEACTELSAGGGVYEQFVHLLESARKEHCADPWAYSSVLFALNEAYRSMLGCGMEVLELMAELNVKPDPVMCNLLLMECGQAAACSSGCLVESLDLIKKAVQEGITLDQLPLDLVTKSAVQVCANEHGALSLGEKLIRFMIKGEILLKSDSIEAYLHGCAETARGSGVFMILNGILDIIHSSNPPENFRIESEVIRLCALAGGKGGSLSKALSVMQYLRLHDVQYDGSAVFDVMEAAHQSANGEGCLYFGYKLLQTNVLQTSETSSGSEILCAVSSAADNSFEFNARVKDPYSLLSKTVGHGRPYNSSSTSKASFSLGVASEVVLESIKILEASAPQQLNRAVSLVIETILKECAGVKSAGFVEGIESSETQEGIFRLGIEVLQTMVDAGLKPSDPAICSLISTSCNSGLVANEGISRCIQLLKRIKVAKWKIESKQLEYFAKRILEFCAVVARISGVATAMDIVSILQSRSIPIEDEVYNMLMRSAEIECSRAPFTISLGLSLLKQLKSMGVNADATVCEHLVSSAAVAQTGAYKTAMEVLKFVDGQARETKPRDKPFADFLTSRMTANKPSRASGESLSASSASSSPSAASKFLSPHHASVADAPRTPKDSIKRMGGVPNELPKTPTPLLSASKCLPRSSPTRRALFAKDKSPPEFDSLS
uniref:Pentacotripeptide-repeat region of PRORP domain-containing protein n=1 Tax=Hanusia phi TaxID=3032 RepID=A0A7S0E4Y7_9CRYP|mmetsp:Transcript_14819/g.34046  ORF Transcript_14819/g.34046 Transcript_14819/m.34046 type:complete len:895 (+) Transcript_14819:95-2779(+)